jgi:hypothetical protein
VSERCRFWGETREQDRERGLRPHRARQLQILLLGIHRSYRAGATGVAGGGRELPAKGMKVTCRDLISQGAA